MKIFHFTLGPVQTFVAQARRTRDLWAGSFLLSWLSGQAMKSVLEQDGKILFPDVGNKEEPKDGLLRAILRQGGTPHIGSIPNRFKADVPDDFQPRLVKQVINDRWQTLADAVYEKFVKNVANEQNRGAEVKEIWTRQIDHFWEINWILGEYPGNHTDDDWLDIRKNWRDHWPEPEGGDHCTVMGDFQEISGFIRAKDKEKQNEFWCAMQNAAPDDRLDIRDNERLCAIALVKRLFPLLNEKLESTIGWIPGGRKKAVGNWPSTTYMAVAPWLNYIAQEGERIDRLKEYLNGVKETVGEPFFKKLASERATRLTMLDALRKTERRIPRSNGGSWGLDDIDGDLLHLHALQNHRNTYLSDRPTTDPKVDVDADIRPRLLDTLSNLYKHIGKKPRSYYALLLMDGDRLGKMLRDQDQAAVSRALLAFTGKVDDCVKQKEHSGITIYAGGDDVLALLPLDRAIACAITLRDVYGTCFDDVQINATASCAIVFAHHQVPLRKVLSEAHHQLEHVAKDQNGRDSLAIAVLKPSGVTAQWVNVWNISPADALQELVARIDAGEYPRGFFHKLRDRYGFYADEDQAILPDSIDVRKLLVAEYMQSRDRKTTLQNAEQAVDRLLNVCKRYSRHDDGSIHEAAALTMNGGFIARFLTQEED